MFYMNNKQEAALEKSLTYMSKNGYQHGPCLGISSRGDIDGGRWSVEFAYAGLTERSPTTDPPSIVLLVDIAANVVAAAEM